MLNDTACEVVKIPGDGNCLFGAITHQLFQYEPHTIMYKAMVATLREMAVQFVWNNSFEPDIIAQVISRTNDEFPELTGRNMEQTMVNFARHLSRDGTWGGSESLCALNQLFHMKINIVRENGLTTTIEHENVVNEHVITIVYRGPTNGWNHYDSFQRTDKLSDQQQSQQRNDSTTQRSDMERVNIHGGQCMVYKTKPDGNCLIAALVHQLFQCEIGDVNHDQYTTRMRIRVVQHIRNRLNERQIQHLLDDRIDDEYVSLRRFTPSIAREELLDILEQPTVWTGNEFITAIARMFRCIIVTLWENGPITVVSDATSLPNRIIRIVYCQSNGRWNHYDSFKGFTRTTSVDTMSAGARNNSYIQSLLRMSNVNESANLVTISDDETDTSRELTKS